MGTYKTITLFSDPHIEEKSIIELEKIFQEIYDDFSSDELIMAGDYYEKSKPTPREIIFGTKWAYKFKQKYKKVIFLRGNHDKSEDISAIDYLKYIGITIVDDYTDEYNQRLYVGHFMVVGSRLEYGTARCSLSDLKDKKRIILGHQHSFQKLSDNAYHLGSIRYCNFNEAKDTNKFIAKIDNKNEIHFVPLSSPTPMYSVNSIEELSTVPTGMVKVRLVISSFDQFKREINAISKLKHKYNIFKTKLNFTKGIKNPELNMSNSLVKTKQKCLLDILKEGIDKIEDKDVKKLLEEVLDEG